jgi:CxxC motif-containing protein (DUF1111 family)
MTKTRTILIPAVVVVLSLGVWLFGVGVLRADFSSVRDPGVRGGDPGAGGPIGSPIAPLTADEREMFDVGLEDFSEAEGVTDGLGPRMNLDGCAGCHVTPATGGSSPAVNPQVAFATKGGGTNQFPSAVIFSGGYTSPKGPIREVRFQFNPDGTRDGGVHNTATITGRTGADGCSLALDDIRGEFANHNVIFRIPTPVFGAGLIEQINDGTILGNLNANSFTKNSVGISGRPNRNGNDGTITRFGWKAQNKSLLLFSGEAYNVEMGITNELFQQEREEKATCNFVTVPNDVTPSVRQISAIENFANFQRFLAPPTPVTTSFTTTTGKFVSAQSIADGKNVFMNIGCAFCHTPTLKTGSTTVAALRNQTVNLFSDVALHQMGPGLADDILQGAARGDEFRTSPLWGLGQRFFFLHDGRTPDLKVAIQAHKSAGNSKFGPSEANKVIDNFNNLRDDDQQDLLNFLRSL